ncbi:MAG: hypothetical protein IPK80_07085 [Nannocystis sp.]|nr:hypothetical protein [Nannocystis sp.]
MDTTQLRSLVFLLSFGELALGCNGDDGGSGDTDTTTNNNTNTQTTSPGTESASSGATTQPGESDNDSAASDSGSTSAGTTASTVDPSSSAGFLTTNTSGTTDDPSTTGPDFPPPSELCATYADLMVECYPRYSDYAAEIAYYCDSTIAEGADIDGPACGAALEEAYACLSGLTCRELYAEFEAEPIKCATAFADAEKACPTYFNEP